MARFLPSTAIFLLATAVGCTPMVFRLAKFLLPPFSAGAAPEYFPQQCSADCREDSLATLVWWQKDIIADSYVAESDAYSCCILTKAAFKLSRTSGFAAVSQWICCCCSAHLLQLLPTPLHWQQVVSVAPRWTFNNNKKKKKKKKKKNNNNNNRQWSLQVKADQLRTSKTMDKISVA